MNERLVTSESKADRKREGVILRQYAALPWRAGRDGHPEVMLVTSRRRARWIVPKGWRVKGRTPPQSAATEAFEEAGVFGNMDKDAIGSYRFEWDDGNGRVELREVVVFGLEVKATLLNWPEKGQRTRSWMSAERAAEIASDQGLGLLLRRWGSRHRDAARAETASGTEPAFRVS